MTPEVGERRLDEWLARSAGLVRAGTGTWRTIGRLPEEPEDNAIATRRPAAPPLRRIEGRLRLWASPVSVPVVLEMLPWYCSRVVLDLRPKDLTKKMAWLRRETYFRTSHALLDELRTYFEHGPSERVEGLREVGDEVGLGLDADRQAHQRSGDLQRRAGRRRVRHLAGVLDERLDRAERLGQREQLGVAHDLERGRLAARAA